MTRLSPDLGPSGETDLDLAREGIEEIADEGLVYVEGQGWLDPADAEGLPSITYDEFMAYSRDHVG